MQGKLGCFCCTWTILVGIRSRFDVFVLIYILDNTSWTYVYVFARQAVLPFCHMIGHVSTFSCL